MENILEFLIAKRDQLYKEAELLNNALIDYEAGIIDYSEIEVYKIAHDRNQIEEKAEFLGDLIIEITKGG